MPSRPKRSVHQLGEEPKDVRSQQIAEFRSKIISAAHVNFAKAQMFAYKALLPDMSVESRLSYENIVAQYREKALALVEAAKVADELLTIAGNLRSEVGSAVRTIIR